MNSLIRFFVDDWYFAIPLTLMSLVAFALVVWRYMLNLSAKSDLDTFLPLLQDAIRKKGSKGAAEACRLEKGLIPSVLYVAGLEAADQGVAAMRKSMANAIELEIQPRLNFLLAPIMAIAKIATMLGLLGTVISMTNTFNKIGEAANGGGAGGMTAQASAIGLALYATALGLITAIPLVFTHVLFKEWNHNFELKMKAAAQKLITLVQNVKAGK